MCRSALAVYWIVEQHIAVHCILLHPNCIALAYKRGNPFGAKQPEFGSWIPVLIRDQNPSRNTIVQLESRNTIVQLESIGTNRSTEQKHLSHSVENRNRPKFIIIRDLSAGEQPFDCRSLPCVLSGESHDALFRVSEWKFDYGAHFEVQNMDMLCGVRHIDIYKWISTAVDIHWILSSESTGFYSAAYKSSGFICSGTHWQPLTSRQSVKAFH